MVGGAFEIIVEETPDPVHISELVEGLVAYNESRAEPRNRQPVGVFLRNGRETLGGADGYTGPTGDEGDQGGR